MAFAGIEDRNAIEAEMAWEDRDVPKTVHALLSGTAGKYPGHNAVSFQILSGPKDKAETFSWRELYEKTVQTANLFRSLGVGPNDVVAYVLPNCNETILAFLGGSIAGIVNPINPLLEPEQIGAILHETEAKVVVTLKPFPRTDVAEKTARAIRLAPNVKTVLEVDLCRYLTPPKSWIVPFLRPKHAATNDATYKDFNAELALQPKTLQFEDPQEDRVAAYFHTGGTTGMPKVAQHRYSGMIYNGWVGSTLLFNENDVVICPLPLFHVFACQAVMTGVMMAGSHAVFPTPQGYRGDGVFDNFWKLCERWKASFIFTVPTAISAKMQRPVNADISSIKNAFSGSAPLPVELFRRFQEATGVNIIEGYGLTEATCVVSGNPVDGEKKVGSIGVTFPYTRVKIIKVTSDGAVECETDEIGEICIANPGVYVGNTYTEAAKNKDLFHGEYLRTGDLGRFDADGYLWITGRAKDLIIRGGHNIDPAEIEEALLGHDAVAFAGAIGQPDAYSGEVPCAFVELVAGADVTEAELLEFCKKHVHERGAHPKHLEILGELPKTAVGKVFKPDLRKSAITRVYNDALAKADLTARVTSVVEDKTRGLVAQVDLADADRDAVSHVLGDFTRPWDEAGTAQIAAE